MTAWHTHFPYIIPHYPYSLMHQTSSMNTSITSVHSTGVTVAIISCFVPWPTYQLDLDKKILAGNNHFFERLSSDNYLWYTPHMPPLPANLFWLIISQGYILLSLEINKYEHLIMQKNPPLIWQSLSFYGLQLMLRGTEQPELVESTTTVNNTAHLPRWVYQFVGFTRWVVPPFGFSMRTNQQAVVPAELGG